jgi:hypothetical protein
MAQDEHLAFHSRRRDDNLVAGAWTVGGVDEGLDLHCGRWRGWRWWQRRRRWRRHHRRKARLCINRPSGSCRPKPLPSRATPATVLRVLRALPTKMAQKLADNAVEWLSTILAAVHDAKTAETKAVEAA